MPSKRDFRKFYSTAISRLFVEKWSERGEFGALLHQSGASVSQDVPKRMSKTMVAKWRRFFARWRGRKLNN